MFRNFSPLRGFGVRSVVSYVQGQSPKSGIREYFYYVDHQGMLFLDDARMKNFTSCFKEKKFLAFFFRRLKRNDTDRYTEDFPYLSLCGRERNFVRCDDLPIVFTHVLQTPENLNLFSYAHAGDLLVVPFQPDKIFMSTNSGRVYHPAPETTGGIGLVRSKLAIEFSNSFEFLKGEESDPSHFTWKGTRYTLDSDWYRDKISNREGTKL
ncbi:UPF0598 protein CG30010 [Fopius arisanus]|uniref:CH082 protein n=1 Tax=Fopius arisanus TaxID=64838 RepID=A0A0C9QME6_9HYME|nr:PREDICTED: UPF0598 protein CG30010 [Fopius arisanus]XP_011310636.1 PREDICTED: UPF0598 protein CG30010 [Fopius arisanus]